MLNTCAPAESVVVKARQALLLATRVVADDVTAFGQLGHLAEVDQLIVVMFVIAMHDTLLIICRGKAAVPR